MALKAVGTLFKVNTVTVAEVTNITTNFSLDELDVTNHDVTNAWRSFITGLKGMELTIEGNYIPSNVTHNATGTDGLLNLLEGGTTQTMSLVLADGPTTFSFTGLVRSMTINAPVDGALSFSCDIRVISEPTLA